MSEDGWADLNIPEAWTATSMLRSMVVDHLGPNKAFDGALDDETRNRMTGLAILGHVTLADTTATLIEQFSVLIGEVGELATRIDRVQEAVIRLAEHVDNLGGNSG